MPIALIPLLLVAPIPSADSQASPSSSVRTTVIGYRATPAGRDDDFRRGVELGIAEAGRAGDLLGRQVRLVEVAREAAAGPGTTDQSRRSGVHAIVAVPPLSASEVAEWAQTTRPPVILIGGNASPVCSPFVFRIGPPPTSAAALLRTASPRSDASSVPPTSEGTLEVALWHPSLERFGAAQLSERYRARYSAPMSSDAWAGWMAVKIIWESSLRAGDEPNALRNAIARGAFDGHKGRALRFGPDGELHQPLVIVRADSAGSQTAAHIVAEVPWPAPPPPVGAQSATVITDSASSGRMTTSGSCAEPR